MPASSDAGTQSDSDGGIDRRYLMIGGVAAAASGWYFFVRDDESAPERTVQTLFGSLSAANLERYRNTIHPDSYLYPENTTEEEFEEQWGDVTISVHQADERRLRAVVRESQDLEGDALDEEVTRAEEQYDELLAEHGLEDYSIVYVSITVSEDDEQVNEDDGYVLLVRDDREWLVWDDRL
ncbi:hypothetical protein ACFO5R_13875 [Halosolutus amylolyticus]|uniref:Uncharacterized protein n=1 Tax=Halosolutus amylolyticus TaxID=2932267 RepID=A0ABD5PR34_9EURY|nr:hypothetical protein [Halosolutus amylolyticus]